MWDSMQLDADAEQTPGEEGRSLWRHAQPLAGDGTVDLWRVTLEDGGSALLQIYPLISRPHARRRFVSAVERRAKLPEHPRVVSVAGVDVVGRSDVMLANAAGKPLSALLDRQPLSPEIATSVFRDVAEALSALERAGLPPVDLSAADVLVDGDRGLLLGDAGLYAETFNGRCRDLDHAAPERVAAQHAYADGRVGHLIGLAGSRRAVRPTAESMTYSFASVLRTALEGPSDEADPDEDRASAHPGLAHVFERALSDDPRRRYRTPAMVLDALEAAIALHEPPRQAVPEFTPRRRTRPGPAWLVGGGLLVAVVAGAALGAMTTASDPSGPVTLTAAGLSVQAPTGWSLASAGDASFDPGPDALVARSASEPHVTLTVTRSGEALLATLADIEPTPVDLAGRGAWRYPDADVGDVAADVYAIETTAGPIVAACQAPPAAGRSLLSACGGIVGTLAVRDARVLPLGGDSDTRAELADVLAGLESEQGQGRRALATASRPYGQAVAADRLARTYDRARDAAAAIDPVGPPGAHARLISALAITQRAYASLAAAARVRSSGAYRRASGSVADGERDVSEAVAALSLTAAAD